MINSVELVEIPETTDGGDGAEEGREEGGGRRARRHEHREAGVSQRLRHQLGRCAALHVQFRAAPHLHPQQQQVNQSISFNPLNYNSIVNSSIVNRIKSDLMVKEILIKFKIQN